jgi:hypothetical protein
MIDNKTSILNQFEELKGQFVINASWNIERLVAIGSDEWDYYWITYNGRKFSWNTCVGGLMPLKGHLRDKDYKELIRLARLNHFDQATLWGNVANEESEQYVRRHKHELTRTEGTEEFLTDIYWDLI